MYFVLVYYPDNVLNMVIAELTDFEWWHFSKVFIEEILWLKILKDQNTL